MKEFSHFWKFWIANIFVLYVFSLILPGKIVLGTQNLSTVLAVVLSGFLFTALASLGPPLVEKAGLKLKNEIAWGVTFFAANVFALWFVKRLAVFTGLGIENNYIVVLVAAGAAVAQLLVAKCSGLVKKSKKG